MRAIAESVPAGTPSGTRVTGYDSHPEWIVGGASDVKGAGAIAGSRKIWEPAAVIASPLYALVFAGPASVHPPAWGCGSHGDGLGNIVELSRFREALLPHLPSHFFPLPS